MNIFEGTTAQCFGSVCSASSETLEPHLILPKRHRQRPESPCLEQVLTQNLTIRFSGSINTTMCQRDRTTQRPESADADELQAGRGFDATA